MAYSELVSWAQRSMEREARNGALQTRDRSDPRIWDDPGLAAHRSANTARCTASGTPARGD
jgi:hypothetical protein